MQSNIVEITKAIAASYAGVPHLKASYDYLPAALDDWPAHAFWVQRWQVLHATEGGMRLGWNLEGVIVCAPINEPVSEQILKEILVGMIDALFRNLEASGTLADGQVQLQGGTRTPFVLAGIEWQAQRVQYFVEESFPYTYALGTEPEPEE